MVRRAPGAGEAPVYDISGRRAAPLAPSLQLGSRATAAEKRVRRKRELQNTETDLIQDFEFPTVSQRIKVSPDGRYIFASGTYPPQLHVYDTTELSLKFKRHVNYEIVDFQILEESWRKFALLTADRYVDLHSPFGSHFSTRVPRHGRDLMLHRGSCDLFIAGDGRDIWRLNLDQGRFLAPIPTHSGLDGGNNVCGISPVNSLLAFGGENGTVDIWDPRVVGTAQKPAGSLDVHAALLDHDESTRRLVSRGPRPEITALRFDESDGVTLAVGTSAGFVSLFDLRSPHVVLARDQGNGLPVHSIRLHDDRKHCLSADPKSVKVWDRTSGKNMVAIEPDADINHLCVIGNSGVMCTAVEAPRVKTFYVPALGAAPKWCAFLDNFTEELEDGRQKRLSGASRLRGLSDEEEEEVYENYKFVSHDELEGLGLGHLTGTDMLKAYMHGYFVHQQLYRRAVEVAEPFAYEKYRKEKAREKIEAERQSRITKKKTKRVKVKVNQNVVDAIQEKKDKGKKGQAAMSILEDDRFKAMFENRDFAVDQESERFQHLNPSGPSRGTGEQEEDGDSDEEYLEQFELVDDGNDVVASRDKTKADETWSSDESDSEDYNDDDVDDEAGEDGEMSIAKPKSEKTANSRKHKAPRMYELGEAAELNVVPGVGLRGSVSRKVREQVSLGARVKVNRLDSSGRGDGPRRGARKSQRGKLRR